MPIVLDRKTGEIISKPEYTQEQQNKLWEHLVRKWIKMHPDKFMEMVKDNGNKEN